MSLCVNLKLTSPIDIPVLGPGKKTKQVYSTVPHTTLNSYNYDQCKVTKPVKRIQAFISLPTSHLYTSAVNYQPCRKMHHWQNGPVKHNYWQSVQL